MQNLVTYYNDELIKHSEIHIPANDRGYLFGDGFFETILFVNGKSKLLDFHKKRFDDAWRFFEFEDPKPDIEKIIKALVEFNKKQNPDLDFNNYIARITVTRKGPSHGYLPIDKQPSILIEIKTDIPKKLEDFSQSLVVSNYKKFFDEDNPMYFKSNNMMQNSLAKIEAKKFNFYDSIMLNVFGEICETSSCNIFWIKNKKIHTPAAKSGVVKGVMRDLILSNTAVQSDRYEVDDIKDSDLIFVTNSVIGVLAVKEVYNPESGMIYRYNPIRADETGASELYQKVKNFAI